MGDFAMISGRGRKVAAFTLIELMVVIAIVATLLVLLLPAITSAVEAGRRTRCGANASRLALAMTAYDGRNGSLPGIRNKLAIKSPGGGGLRLTSASGALQPGHFPMPESKTNWFVVLLPHVERTDTYDAVVRGSLWVGNTNMWTPPNETKNLTKTLTECPSRGDFYALAYGYENMHYRANASLEYFRDEDPSLKILHKDRRPPALLNRNDGAIGDNANGIFVSVADIATGDGTSCTLLIAEGRRECWYPKTWSDPGNFEKIPGLTASGTFTALNNHNEKFTIHSDPGTSRQPDWNKDCIVSANGMLFGFPKSNKSVPSRIIGLTADRIEYPTSAEGSFANQSAAVHPGGANVAFVDGSCRFLRDELPPHVYGHLLTHRSVWSGNNYSSNSERANRFLKCPPASTPYMLQAKDY